MPLIAQFKAAADGKLIDGTSPLEFAKELRDWGADIIGVNCSGPAQIFDIATSMVESDIPVCAMPNAGSPETVEDRQMYLSTPENFGVFASTLQSGRENVGGCCGTNPEHINGSPPPLECSHRRRQATSRLSMNLPPEPLNTDRPTH